MKDEQNPQITLASLKALRDSLKFYHMQFQDQQTRDFIMNLVLQAVSGQQNPDIQVMGL
jgi:hypothetical protein